MGGQRRRRTPSDVVSWVRLPGISRALMAAAGVALTALGLTTLGEGTAPRPASAQEVGTGGGCVVTFAGRGCSSDDQSTDEDEYLQPTGTYHSTQPASATGEGPWTVTWSGPGGSGEITCPAATPCAEDGIPADVDVTATVHDAPGFVVVGGGATSGVPVPTTPSLPADDDGDDDTTTTSSSSSTSTSTTTTTPTSSTTTTVASPAPDAPDAAPETPPAPAATGPIPGGSPFGAGGDPGAVSAAGPAPQVLATGSASSTRPPDSPPTTVTTGPPDAGGKNGDTGRAEAAAPVPENEGGSSPLPGGPVGVAAGGSVALSVLVVLRRVLHIWGG